MPSRKKPSPSAASLDAADTAANAIEDIRTPRTVMMEKLREYALLGEKEFEDHVAEATYQMAKKYGYAAPRSTTLSQMQTDTQPGASTFYLCVIRVRKMLRAGDVEGIRALSTLYYKKAKSSVDLEEVHTEDLVKAVLLHHRLGKLKPAHYKTLRTILP